jgi:hypothetical protein
MIYTDRKYLTILKLQDDSDMVSFDVLKELLMERPSNMIYCENIPGGGMRNHKHGGYRQGFG